VNARRHPLAPGPLLVFRLEDARYAPTWHEGHGARLFGGRWNRKGQPAIYLSFEPACAILEVAVHKGFEVLETLPHTFSGVRISDPSKIRVVMPGELPEQAWLEGSPPTEEQQRFGDALLAKAPLVALPSVVSQQSWSLVINPSTASGLFALEFQDDFVLDGRLNPRARANSP
jgi:RES domain-containing protein